MSYAIETIESRQIREIQKQIGVLEQKITKLIKNLEELQNRNDLCEKRILSLESELSLYGIID